MVEAISQGGPRYNIDMLGDNIDKMCPFVVSLAKL